MPDSSAARAYARIRYRLLLADLALTFVVLAMAHLSGASRMLAAWWEGWVTLPAAALAGYLSVLGAARYLLRLPLHLYASFFLEHRFHLSRMTFPQWGVRELKHLLVSATLSLLVVEGFYALLRHAPRTWPVWATLGWVGLSVVLARIFPTVLLPIFYKTAPLEDAALRARLLALCGRVGLPVLGVFRFELGTETRKANAALAGLGRTRRVLLSDTLLRDFTPEEIEGVLAHELAHQRFRHITKSLLLGAAGSWCVFHLTARAAPRALAALGLRALSDPAGIPVLLLWFSLLGLVGLPLQNGIARHFEWQADRFAVEVSRAPRAFAEALRRLAALNLADPQPPRWIEVFFYDHPRIRARIDAAERACYSERRG